jgi:transposase
MQWFEPDHEQLIVKCQLNLIQYLKDLIDTIENHIVSAVKLRKQFQMLLTITGIGKILALTIMLEVGDINRFAKVGHYSSYCCCVQSKRYSNGKKKAENNRRNGNRSLAWAYVEAANFARRYCKLAQQFYQHKAAKSNPALAVKALSNKLARASYYVMRDQVPYQAQHLFR